MKRYLGIALLFVSFAAVADTSRVQGMKNGTALPTSIAIPAGATAFTCNSGNVSSETVCQAAPGSGKTLHIIGGTISASAAVTCAITTAAAGGCTSSTTLWGPHNYSANSGGGLGLHVPIDVPTNQTICCKPSSANCSCTIQGWSTTP